MVLPVIMISVTWARGGRQATISTAAPISSGCSIWARASADGGLGRLSRISVTTSPGQMFVHRMPDAQAIKVKVLKVRIKTPLLHSPFSYSSTLIASPSEFIANLDAQ